MKKVAYIASGLTVSMTFVVNEMDAHSQAGWDIVPLVSCKKYKYEHLSPLMVKWNDKAYFWPGCFQLCASFLVVFLCHPLRALRVIHWLGKLAFVCMPEFLRGLMEVLPAFYYARVCHKNEIQHIHVHFASRSLTLGIMLSFLIQKKISCTVHAFDIFMRSDASLRFRLSHCSFISAISEFNIKYLKQHAGETIADLCHVIHCGINTMKFSSEGRSPQVGEMVATARLTPKKGFDTAIRACSVLKKKGLSFRYHIIGGGEQHDELEQLIKDLDLQEEVILVGSQDNDQIVNYLKRAMVFLMPCRRTPAGDMDGIPVAMMEAMACETPVLSAAVSGIPELVIHNQTGWLIQENNIDELVAVLERVLYDIEAVRKIGIQARRHIVEQFSIRKNAEQLRQLFQDVVGVG